MTLVDIEYIITLRIVKNITSGPYSFSTICTKILLTIFTANHKYRYVTNKFCQISVLLKRVVH